MVHSGEITVEGAIHCKEQVLRDVACRNSSVINYEVDNNGSIEKTIEQLKCFIGLS